MKSKKYIKNHIEQVLYVVLAVSVIALLILAIPLVMAYFEKTPESMQELVESCSQMNLTNASKCVLDNTRSFYKYNLENVGKDLSFDELKEQGGVCSNWSEYYSELGEELGFNTKNVIIPVTKGYSHEFSVWSAEDSYCILDQTELMCVDLQ